MRMWVMEKHGEFESYRHLYSVRTSVESGPWWYDRLTRARVPITSRPCHRLRSGCCCGCGCGGRWHFILTSEMLFWLPCRLGRAGPGRAGVSQTSVSGTIRRRRKQQRRQRRLANEFITTTTMTRRGMMAIWLKLLLSIPIIVLVPVAVDRISTNPSRIMHLSGGRRAAYGAPGNRDEKSVSFCSAPMSSFAAQAQLTR